MSSSGRNKLSMEFLTLQDHFVQFLNRYDFDLKIINDIQDCDNEANFFNFYFKNLVKSNPSVSSNKELDILKNAFDLCASHFEQHPSFMKKSRAEVIKEAKEIKNPEVKRLVEDALKYEKLLFDKKKDIKIENQAEQKPGFKKTPF